MAVFNSKANGNWSSGGQTTWTQTGVPGDGDTVSISGHRIIVDTNTTIGNLPSSGVNVIDLYTTGALVVNTGVILTIRGCFQGQNSGLTQEAGSTVRYEVPSGVRYWHRTGRTHNEVGKIVINGTSGNRATFESVGTGVAYIDYNGFLRNSLMEATYCDFKRIGDSVEKFVEPYLNTVNLNFWLRNCTVSGCGSLATPTNMHSGAGFELSNTIFTDSAATRSAEINTADSPSGLVPRLVSGCSFDKQVDFFAIRGFVIVNNYFNAGFSSTSASGVPGWTFYNNFVTKTFTSSLNYLDSVSGCYFYQKEGGSNPHFVQPPVVRNYIISGCIWEHAGDSIVGDGIVMSSPSFPITGTIVNNIVLPNPFGNTSCTLFSALGNSNITFSAEHNTYFNNLAGTSAQIAETYSGHSGMLRSFRSNLAWSATAGTAEILGDSSTNDAPSGYITNCGYNGVWNGSSILYEVNPGVITNSFTGFDVAGNPNFKDRTRNLSTWGAYMGTDGSSGAALTLISQNPTLIPSLVSWVRSGFIVRNSAFNGTAHDSGVIGAMGYQQLPTVINPFTSVIVGIANDVIG
jgi:hypothetical protein